MQTCFLLVIFTLSLGQIVPLQSYEQAWGLKPVDFYLFDLYFSRLALVRHMIHVVMEGLAKTALTHLSNTVQNNNEQ